METRLGRFIVGAVVLTVTVIVALFVVSLYSEVTLETVLPGVSGGILAVFFTGFLKRYQDERFSEILLKASRNALVLLIIVLPFVAGYVILGPSQLVAGLIVYISWIGSITIYWLSVVYYYRQ